MVTNLPFLRWLVAHPALRAGETTTAFLTEHPPLSAPPLRLPDRPWRGGFRLNLPVAAARAAAGPERRAFEQGAQEQSSLSAPMPGTVIRVLVAPGDRVQPRQPLVVLEAMKMETPVVSPYEATVSAVHVERGRPASRAATVLVELEE